MYSYFSRHLHLFVFACLLYSSFFTIVNGRSLLEDNIDEKIIVSGVSPGNLYESAVQAFIFDAEDIENLPVDTIPDMLRYAPGVHIQQADNGTWGIGIRGMNSRYLSRVSFLVDEQNIYSGLFSGLFGSQHDMLLEDVATIEVVYGPGGILWGTNAMNGMVNVVMKTAFDTVGFSNRIIVGSKKNAVQSRYGWNFGESSAMRVYAKTSSTNSSESSVGHKDTRETWRTGWRYDSMHSSVSLFSFSGEVYGSKLGVAQALVDYATGSPLLATGDENQIGANTQIKWTKEQAFGAKFSIRGWAGFSQYETNLFRADVITMGVSGTYNYPVSDESELIMRAGFLSRKDDTEGYDFSDFKDKITNTESNLSLQYNWDWTSFLKLSLGATYQHYKPLDRSAILPVMSLVSKLGDDSRIWYSYSQGNRTYPEALQRMRRFSWALYPLSPEQEVTIPTPYGDITPQNNFYYLAFSENLKPEKTESHQLGYQVNLMKDRLDLSATVFSNQYRDVYASFIGDIGAELWVENPFLTTQLYMGNGLDGHTWGGELDLQWQVLETLEFKLGYAYLQSDWMNIPPSESVTTNPNSTINLSNYGPTHSGNILISWNPMTAVRVDLGYRYSMGFEDTVVGKQEAISQLDVRMSWERNERFRASLVLRNMLDDRVDEGTRLYHNLSIPTLIEKEAYVELTYRF